MSRFEQSVSALKTADPDLAERLIGCDCGRVRVMTAADGAPAYAVEHEGELRPVSNVHNPLQVINEQLSALGPQLLDFTRPILVVGFNPGAELLLLFENREKISGNECKQPIWVVVDSMITFCGFLKAYDARPLLESDRVQFIWWETLESKVRWLEEHPAYPHTFTFVSGSPEALLDEVLAPLVELIQTREQEMVLWHQENERYYASLSDEQLADRMVAKGRIMIPSCSWSTVVQYSVRDTAKTFEREGWDSLVLESPAMISAYYVIRSVNSFKPDIFLYVGHLREEIIDLVPDDLLVVTWVQDTMPAINCVEAAQRWNARVAGRQRDLLIGYTDQLLPYGYRKDRLASLNMLADTRIFKPRQLSEEELGRFGCDLCFASNRGLPTDRMVREQLVHLFADYGVDEDRLMGFHDRLWSHYRSGKMITSYEALIDFLELDARSTDQMVQLLFWRLNDVIYRHTVLEWVDAYAEQHPDFRFHLYGKGWEEHPRFSKYARGELRHGALLSIAYQAAGKALHLNSLEGAHQRAYEIMASGATLLSRSQPLTASERRWKNVLRRCFECCMGLSDEQLTDDEQKECLTRSWRSLQRIIDAEGTHSPEAFRQEIMDMFWVSWSRTFDWMVESRCSFDSADDLFLCLSRADESANDSRKVVNSFLTISFFRQFRAGMRNLFAGFPEERWEEEMAVTIGGSWMDSLIAYAQASGDVAETLEHIQGRFLELKWATADIWIDHATRLMQRGGHEEALVQLESVWTLNLNARLWFRCGILFASLGQRDEAVRAVEKAYALSESLVNGYSQVAWHLYYDQASWEKLYELARRDDEAGRMTAEWKWRIAFVHARWGRFGEAKRWVAYAYREDVRATDGNARIGGYLLAAHFDYDFCMEWVRKDADLGRLSPSYKLNYGALLAQKEISKSLSWVAEGYSECAQLQDGYARVAWHRYIIDDLAYEKVIPYFEKELSMNRLSCNWRLSYAQALLVISHFEKADEQVRLAYEESDIIKNGFARGAYSRFLVYRKPEEERSFFEKEIQLGRLEGQYALWYAALLAAGGAWMKAQDVVREAYSSSEVGQDGFALSGWYRHAVLARDFEQALVEFERDRRLGRLSAQTELLAAVAKVKMGFRSEGDAVVQQIYESNASVQGGYFLVGFADYARTGDEKYLLHTVEKDIRENRGRYPYFDWLYGFALGAVGREDEASFFQDQALSRTQYARQWATSWCYHSGIHLYDEIGSPA